MNIKSKVIYQRGSPAQLQWGGAGLTAAIKVKIMVVKLRNFESMYIISLNVVYIRRNPSFFWLVYRTIL